MRRLKKSRVKKTEYSRAKNRLMLTLNQLLEENDLGEFDLSLSN